VEATEPYPNGWIHHLIIQNRSEVDTELMNWIKEAYDFAVKKSFQWPRDAEAVRSITNQEFRWLLEGLAIDQPKAVKKLKIECSVMCTLCQGQFGFLYSNQIGIYDILTVLYHKGG